MHKLAVPVFVTAQILLVHWGVRPLYIPPAPDMQTFPAALDEWSSPMPNPVSREVMEQLNADQLLDRTYSRAGFDAPVDVLVAWYAWRQEGSREPHSPLVCLPASGWVTDRSRQIQLATSAGTIAANIMSIHNASEYGVMLYWYQMPHRVSAGDWNAKFTLIEEAIRDRRTDGAFVRVFVPFAGSAEPLAAAAAESVGRSLYPALRAYLPQ